MEDLIEKLREEKIILTKENLRQLKNKLTHIILCADKIRDQREEMYKTVNDIRGILDSYEEK